MSRKRSTGAKATGASMVLEVLRKRDATCPERAVDIKVFKDLTLATVTLSYTIANLVEQGIVVQTEDGKYYYSAEGYKKLEKKLFRGYSMFIVIPAVSVIIVLLLKYFFGW